MLPAAQLKFPLLRFVALGSGHFPLGAVHLREKSGSIFLWNLPFGSGSVRLDPTISLLLSRVNKRKFLQPFLVFYLVHSLNHLSGLSRCWTL